MSDPTLPLVQRAGGGDAAAVDELIRLHLPGLHAFVRLHMGRLLRAREESMDLVQSVCRELLEDLPALEYRGEAAFRHWLYTAALNKIRNRVEHYRAQKRDAAREVRMPRDTAAEEAALTRCYSAFCSPSRQAALREQIERIERAFAELTEEQRQVILLAKVVGMSRAEMAPILRRSEVAVRSLLSRSLARLAWILAQQARGEA